MRAKRRGLGSFSSYLSEWTQGLSEEERRLLRRDRAVKKIQDQFATLVTPYILEHVNAVYLFSPDTPSKASGADGVSRGTAYAPLALPANAAFKESPREDSSAIPPSGFDAGYPSSSSSLKKKKLIVYVDNSLVSAELNARRELIRLGYLTDFSVELVGFEIKLSRGGYLDKHPYLDRKAGANEQKVDVSRETLPEEDEKYIDEVCSSIDDERLRGAFKRAMTASFAKDRRNSEKG